MAERVLVAMSGGVDSSVAAARLVDQGFDVVGVTLHLWDYPDDGSVKSRCCAPEDLYDARRVADHLGIAHYTFDRREQFKAQVVDPFVEAYLEGATPSPCVSCNRHVKLPELLELLGDLEARWLATGHYARIDHAAQPPALLRAADRRKDQSYFLHRLGPEVLARLRFPLGDATKEEVRAEAARRELPGADKGESQELCFVPTGRYDRFVAERAAGRVRPGPVVDSAGRTLAQHGGIHGFTVGQRKNLGVSLGRRTYVVGLNAERGEVQLGPPSALLADGAHLSDLSLAPGVALPLQCEVAVRYGGTLTPSRVQRGALGTTHLRFERPVRAVVPGQVAVLYQGDRVLGGGRIERALAARAEAVGEARP